MSTLGPSLGALEVGVLVAYFLSGMNIVQAFIYTQTGFTKDPSHIKILIVLVLIIEVVHTALIGVYLYETTVVNFGDVAALAHTPWTLAAVATVGSAAQGLVQIFFAWRIYIVSRKGLIIPIISVTGSIMHLVLSIMAAIKAMTYDLSVLTGRYRWIPALGLAVGASVDMLNTSSLVFILYRSRTEISQSRKLVERIMVWTLETGLLVTLVSILGLILIFALPESTAWLVVVLIFAKLYSNTLLATFNGRTSLRSGGRAHVSILTMTKANFRSDHVGKEPHQPVQIQVERQKIIEGGLSWDETVEGSVQDGPINDAESLKTYPIMSHEFAAEQSVRSVASDGIELSYHGEA